jgi:predicted nucleic acid-binding protein
MLDVLPRAFDLLRGLIAARNPHGAEVFDLFLAAQALSHGVSTLCTYNIRDFVGIPGIEAITPGEALQRYPPQG